MTTPQKEPGTLNTTVEEKYGFVHSVKTHDTIYLSGQVGLEDDETVAEGDLEAQMRAAYANVEKVLALHGATIENVVEETIYVTDIEAAKEARLKMKDEVFGGKPVIANTLIGIDRLALPELLVEIRCIARI